MILLFLGDVCLSEQTRQLDGAWVSWYVCVCACGRA